VHHAKHRDALTHIVGAFRYALQGHENRRSDGQDVALQSRLAERTHDRPTDGFDEFRRAGDREVALVVREEPQPPPEMLERPESSTRVTANPLVSDVAGV